MTNTFFESKEQYSVYREFLAPYAGTINIEDLAKVDILICERLYIDGEPGKTIADGIFNGKNVSPTYAQIYGDLQLTRPEE